MTEQGERDHAAFFRGEEYLAFAEQAIEASEHADDAQDRLELLGRAQAWAMLRVGDLVARLVEVLAGRGAGQ